MPKVPAPRRQLLLAGTIVRRTVREHGSDPVGRSRVRLHVLPIAGTTTHSKQSERAGWELTALSDGRSTVRSYRCWCSQPARGFLGPAAPQQWDAGGGGHVRAAQVGEASAMEDRSDP
jgi:hypothetical protein